MTDSVCLHFSVAYIIVFHVWDDWVSFINASVVISSCRTASIHWSFHFWGNTQSLASLGNQRSNTTISILLTLIGSASSVYLYISSVYIVAFNVWDCWALNTNVYAVLPRNYRTASIHWSLHFWGHAQFPEFLGGQRSNTSTSILLTLIRFAASICVYISIVLLHSSVASDPTRTKVSYWVWLSSLTRYIYIFRSYILCVFHVLDCWSLITNASVAAPNSCKTASIHYSLHFWGNAQFPAFLGIRQSNTSASILLTLIGFADSVCLHMLRV